MARQQLDTECINISLLHGFFCRMKKTIQRCLTINHAKSAWVFSPDEKTHAKVNGFEHPYQKKSKSSRKKRKHVKVYGLNIIQRSKYTSSKAVTQAHYTLESVEHHQLAMVT